MNSKASSSFLKKRTKKLLLLCPMGCHGANAQAKPSKSLFASFSSEKEVSFPKALS
jgi:hypothetical protein